jgi:hypothetical protein
MNIAILGKSRINNALVKQFEINGITPLVFEKPGDIISVSGEKGAFIIKSRDKDFEVSNIIVTEEPSLDQDNIEYDNANGHKGVISLADHLNPDMLPHDNAPVVFILDYPVDSPVYMFRTALEKAIRLARKKKKVIFFAKSIRTSGDLLENLYKDARNLGIIFFKYSSIVMNYSTSEKVFHITADDMYDSLKICTHTLVLAGKTVYSHDFLKLIKVLRLKLDSRAYVNEDNFFLFPWLTSRKGIYFTR